AIACGVLAVLRHCRTLDQRDAAYVAAEDQIVDDLCTLAIDLRIDLVDECAILLRKLDAGIVRRRDHPHRLIFERIRPAPYAAVRAPTEGVVQLFKDQIGWFALQQQHAPRRFLVATLLRDRLEGLDLRLRAQRRGVRPARR